MSEAPPVEKRRSKRIYILWGVALALLLAAGLLCWLVVVPVWQVRSIVAEYSRNRVFSSFPDWSLPDSSSPAVGGSKAPISAEEAIGRLGGKARAVGALDRYLRMSAVVAPYKWQATVLLGRCGRGALPILERLCGHEDENIRQAAAEALRKIKAAGKKPAEETP